jgi:CheY-like chemotaxis protein
MTAPIRILLVDDEDINNYIAARLIQKALPGAAVTSCLHGKEAMESLIDAKHNALKLPDIILLDISMPVMNAWEFLDEYSRRKIDPDGKCTIFILSSSVYNDDIKRANSYSAVKGFICKPLNVAKIRELFSTEEKSVEAV